MKRILCERQKPVFATHYMNGAIIVDNGKINPIGSVSTFESTDDRQMSVSF